MTRISFIMNGRHNDRGFVQEGYEGVLAARDAQGFDLDIVEFTRGSPDDLQAEIEAAVQRGADGVIVHGSRADSSLEEVAGRHPDCAFLSPGGRAEGPNVWNYAIRHYEAAYLAGLLAGSMTQTGVVGHLSGVFISPGKKGRAGYVDGVRTANPDARIVTGFCGNQDDPDLAARWIEAEAKAGADIIFTMLNYGRSGAVAACRAAGIKQIGNIRDWCAEEPDVFIGSALSRHSWSIRAWTADLIAGKLEGGRNLHPGLEDPSAVGLSLGASVPQDVRTRIEAAREDIVAGRRTIVTTYDGPEFTPDTVMDIA
ncbi:BMP family protein [Sinirhodobacter sp. WL0062]|uniref:BMP family protein n=1 Tax=Rhodobacter flavimaris TaxID=2907145 RepID=A0ABS8YYY2_9RHOB|nr:BMP family protein [Sinirhodobacter sp. WL0062]MCE5975001.1 BMP family protein [Sinirhodobacter sp. WL0062]